MIIFFVLATIGVLSLLLLFKLVWNNKKTPINKKLVLIATSVLGVVLLLASFRGVLHPAAAAGTLVLPFLRRAIGLLSFLPLWNMFSRGGNPFGTWSGANAFQSFGAANDDQTGTSAKTSELEMHLDHESGNIEGHVLVGDYANKSIDALDDTEIADLYHSLKEPESKRLLEAYIARHRPNLGSQTHSEEEQSTTDSGMSIQRAADILGVSTSATKKEVKQAHRRLIQHLHPDQGGSSYLAAEINEARKVLLDNLTQ